MPSLFTAIPYGTIFKRTAPCLANVDNCHQYITTHLHQWLAMQNELLSFDSEEAVLEIINRHSHHERMMILSFEANDSEILRLDESQFNFLGNLRFEKIHFIRPLELAEYRNTLRFMNSHYMDFYFPEGYYYTPEQMLLSTKQIVIDAAKRVKGFLESSLSTKLFNLNGIIIADLDKAIKNRSSEEDIRRICRQPRHKFAQTDVERLFEDQLEEIRIEEQSKYRIPIPSNIKRAC